MKQAEQLNEYLVDFIICHEDENFAAIIDQQRFLCTAGCLQELAHLVFDDYVRAVLRGGVFVDVMPNRSDWPDFELSEKLLCLLEDMEESRMES